MINLFHFALAIGSHGTTMMPSSGRGQNPKFGSPGLRARIEKVIGFFVIVLLVAASRESAQLSNWSSETMVVPVGKFVATMTRPTSAAVKFAVRDVSVVSSIDGRAVGESDSAHEPRRGK